MKTFGFTRALQASAAAVIAFAGLAQTADASVRYLGIGNDEFSADIDTAFDKLAGCLGPGDSGTRVTQQDRGGILAELMAIKNAAMPGDILFIHYSGHGGTEASAEPNDATRGIIGTSPDSGVTFPDPANDTDIANLINMIDIGVNVVTIFDSCFAGEMIDDPSTDITRGMVLGTSNATCLAPGGSIFLPLWCDVFGDMDFDGVPDGDTDGNGILTLGEVWGILDDIQDPTSFPYAEDFGGNNYDSIVWQVPAPSTLGMLAAFAFCASRRRSRRT